MAGVRGKCTRCGQSHGNLFMVGLCAACQRVETELTKRSKTKAVLEHEDLAELDKDLDQLEGQIKDLY